MTDARSIREAAQETGGRALEVHAGTPQLNRWYFSKFSDRVRGDVLELGSGIGNISGLIAEVADSLLATEIEDSYVASLRERFADEPHVDVARFDLEGELPDIVAERTFDTVLSMNVIEHVADDLGAVRRVVSRLKPGGWMLTYVPAMPFAYGPMDEALGHHRRYTRSSFGRLMEDAGLVVDRLEYMNALGLAGWWVNNKVLRRRLPDPSQVGVFERLMPLVRLEDHLPVPVGLGVVCHARRPG
ncbi:MAG: class I SAM-dependent methyltransferase [Deltaproteobacteria bacterium]|nr:class I SAM-dependent methyltransferase [Deltaproteobacteria bacterium]